VRGVCLLRALLGPVLLASALSWAQKPDGGVPTATSAVPPPESMAARVQACTACHGREGRATPDGYFPRLAGKPEGYLYHQLLNFREGRRRYPLMSGLLEHLSDAYLAEMASYFASLEIPYPAPRPPVVDSVLLERGRRLVQQGDVGRGLPACVQCHGSAMTGLSPAVPGLLGLPRDYLNSQLGAWQTGQRQAQSPDCMARVARMLSADEVSAVSAWLASQVLPPSPRAVKSLPQPLPLKCGGLIAGEGS